MSVTSFEVTLCIHYCSLGYTKLLSKRITYADQNLRVASLCLTMPVHIDYNVYIKQGMKR